MGVLLALIPAGNLLWIALFALTALIRVNFAITLLVLAVFKPLVFVADPLLHRLGEAILTANGLDATWTTLYSLPLVPYTRFNNTVVMGGLALGLVAWIPLFFIARAGVGFYRKTVHPRIADSRVVRALEKIPVVSRFVSLVKRFQGIYSVVA